MSAVLLRALSIGLLSNTGARGRAEEDSIVDAEEV